MSAIASVFISHGAPDEVLHDTAARQAWQSLATALDDRPLVVVSAHNEVAGKTVVGGHPKPPTIHDFGSGFDAALFAMRYPAKGAPKLAVEIVHQLRQVGFNATLDPDAGLDHGVWAPLSRTFPDADRAIIPISVDPRASPEQHFHLGQVLASMNQFIVIGSGALTHNLGAVQWKTRNASAHTDAASFADWAASAWQSPDPSALFSPETHPRFRWNHPTPEHLLPLYAALGASRDDCRRVFFRGYSFGVLAMDVFVG